MHNTKSTCAETNFRNFASTPMDSLNIRYQYNPLLTDTVGFFDYCIPLSNESKPPTADSLKKYYDFSIYNYITPQPASRQLVKTTSLFQGHSLHASHKGPMNVNRQSNDWISILFFVCLLILAWIQTYSSKRLSQIFRAVAQPHFVNQLEREGNIFSERITLGLGFIYYTVSSIFIFQLLSSFGILPQGIHNIAATSFILISLFFYQMFKSLAIYFSGFIFNTSDSARLYQLNSLIFNHIIGIILFPITILAFYWQTDIFLYVGITTTLLLLLYRLFRGILTGLANKNFNLFYLFLYLCTLEILPLLLLYKVISIL